MLGVSRLARRSIAALLPSAAVFLMTFVPGVRGVSSPLPSLVYHVTETTTTSEGLAGPSGFGEFAISVSKKSPRTIVVASDDGEATFDLSPMPTEVADAATIWDGKRYVHMSFYFERGLLMAGQVGDRKLRLIAVTDGLQRTLCAKLAQTASRFAAVYSPSVGSVGFTGSMRCESGATFALDYTGTLDQSGSVRNVGLRFKSSGRAVGTYAYAASGSDKLSIPFPVGLIFATQMVTRSDTKP